MVMGVHFVDQLPIQLENFLEFFPKEAFRTFIDFC